MEAVITKAGRVEYLTKQSGNLPFGLTTIKISGDVLALDADATAFPNVVYTIPANKIIRTVSENKLSMKIVLDESVGTFNIGSIGIFTNTNTLYAICNFPGIGQKIKSVLPEVLGNIKTLYLVFQYDEIDTTVTISQTELGEAIDASTSAQQVADDLAEITALKNETQNLLDSARSYITQPSITGINALSVQARNALNATDIVDTCIYDTALDSDGGAWTTKTNSLGWHKELGPFPRRALLVSRNTNSNNAPNLQIYDYDTGALWANFLYLATNAINLLPRAGALEAREGMIICGTTTAVYHIDFAANIILCTYSSNNSAAGKYLGGIEDRNNGKSYSGLWPDDGWTGVHPSSNVYDVAISVEFDAPIAVNRLGLRWPVGAVGTSAGLSIIKYADKSIYNSDSSAVYAVALKDGKAWFSINATYGQGGVCDIPKATGFKLTVESYANPTHTSTYDLPITTGINSGAGIAEAYVGTLGISFIKRNAMNVRQGSVARVNTQINTGWLTGRDLVMALAESSFALSSLIQSDEKLANSSFATDLASWVNYDLGSQVSTWDSGNGGRMALPKLDASNFGRRYQSITTVIGQTYKISITVSGATTYLAVGISAGSTTNYGNTVAVGANVVYFTATATTTFITLYTQVNATTGYIDDISVIPVALDYSVSNNNALVTGTVARAIVATGAEMAGYQSFSAADYMYLPTTVSGIHFGYNDFTINLKWKSGASASSCIMSYGDGSNGWILFTDASGFICFRRIASNAVVESINGNRNINDNVFRDICVRRRNGLIQILIDGFVHASGTFVTQNLTIANATLRIGASNTGYISSNHASTGANAMIALPRIIPFAIEDWQAKEIAAEELVLMQANAKCLLVGSANIANAANDNEISGLRYFATAVGTNVFQNLARINYQLSTTAQNYANYLYGLGSLGTSLVEYQSGGPAGWGIDGYSVAVSEDASSGSHQVNWTTRAALPVGTYTMAIPVKANTRGWQRFAFNAVGNEGLFINSASGVNGAAINGATTSAPIYLEGGYWLFQMTVTVTVSAVSILRIYTTTGDSASLSLTGNNGVGGPAFYVGKPVLRPGTTPLTKSDYIYALSSSDTHKTVASSGANYAIGTSNGLDVFAPSMQLRSMLNKPTAFKYLPKTEIDKLSAAQFALLCRTDINMAFIYDTTRDTDGGSWRYKIGQNSFMREQLNTNIRGAKAVLPSRMLILQCGSTVVTSTLLIYDLDDPSCPLAMAFPAIHTATSAISSRPLHAVGLLTYNLTAMNGYIYIVASGSVVGGVLCLDFILDRAWLADYAQSTTTGWVWTAGLAARDQVGKWQADPTVPVFTSTTIVDVDCAVIPHTPRNPLRLNLPNPTVAIGATGATIIRHDGVVTRATAVSNTRKVSFFPNGALLIQYSTSSMSIIEPSVYLNASWAGVGAVYNTFANGAHAYQTWWPLTPTLNSTITRVLNNRILASVAGGGILLIQPDRANLAKSMHANITDRFNTGFIPGGALSRVALSESSNDLGYITQSNKILNGTFDTDLTNWVSTGSTGSAVPAQSSGKLSLPRTNASNIAQASQQINNLVVGRIYLVKMTVAVAGITANIGPTVNTSTTYTTTLAVGNVSFIFAATATTQWLGLLGTTDATTPTVDDITLTEIASDKTSSLNHANIVGTINRVPVAPNAEMAAYANFSASDYLEVPANSALNAGTGELCAMCWFNQDSSATHPLFSYNTADTADSGWGLKYVTASNRFEWKIGAQTVQVPVTLSTNLWHFVALVRRSTIVELWCDGTLLAVTTSVSASASLTNATLRIGQGNNYQSFMGSNAFMAGQIALPRVSNFAPGQDLVRMIYEQERPLFNAGARCLLLNTAIQSHNYNPDTDRYAIVCVSNGGGISVFSGLTVVERITAETHPSLSAITRVYHSVGESLRVIASASEAVVEFPKLEIRERAEKKASVTPYDPTWGQYLMRTNSATPAPVASIVILEGKAYRYVATVVVNQYGTNTNHGRYEIKGIVWLDTNGTLSVSSDTTILSEVNASLDCSVSVDTTNKTLKITGTGLADIDLVWLANIELYSIGMQAAA